MNSRSVLILLTVAVLVLAAPAVAKKKRSPTEPGQYEDWNGEIDRVEVVESFSTASYSRLVVGPFDTSQTPLPEQDDNTYVPVQDVLKDVVTPLIEGIHEAEVEGVSVEAASETAPDAAGTLILRGTVVDMDPGSRAARYWGGFGAGAARATIEAEFVDAASGRVLLRFTQERVSSGMANFGGGEYHKIMRRNLRAIGDDAGEVLRVFR